MYFFIQHSHIFYRSRVRFYWVRNNNLIQSHSLKPARLGKEDWHMMHWSNRIIKLDQFIGIQARHSWRTAHWIFFLSPVNSVNRECVLFSTLYKLHGWFSQPILPKIDIKLKDKSGNKEWRHDVTICFCNRRHVCDRSNERLCPSGKKNREAFKAPGWGGSEPQIHSERTSDRHDKTLRLSARLYQAYATVLKHFWVRLLINNAEVMFQNLDKFTASLNCIFICDDML